MDWVTSNLNNHNPIVLLPRHGNKWDIEPGCPRNSRDYDKLFSQWKDSTHTKINLTGRTFCLLVFLLISKMLKFIVLLHVTLYCYSYWKHLLKIYSFVCRFPPKYTGSLSLKYSLMRENYNTVLKAEFEKLRLNIRL